jgi:hypothetical protein
MTIVSIAFFCIPESVIISPPYQFACLGNNGGNGRWRGSHVTMFLVEVVGHAEIYQRGDIVNF